MAVELPSRALRLCYWSPPTICSLSDALLPSIVGDARGNAGNLAECVEHRVRLSPTQA